MFENLLMNHPIFLAIIVILLILPFQSYLATDRWQLRHQFGIVMPWILFVGIMVIAAKDGTLSIELVIFTFIAFSLVSALSWVFYKNRKKALSRK